MIHNFIFLSYQNKSSKLVLAQNQPVVQSRENIYWYHVYHDTVIPHLKIQILSVKKFKTNL
jgi:hypothetical protein